DRMVLFRDPSEQTAKYTRAIGDQLHGVELWNLPLTVEHLIFHQSAFNQATGFAMRPFDPRWPLLRARMLQLQGQTDDAIKAYVAFRRAEPGEVFEADGKTPIAPQTQQVLDIYATQFLALAQLDKGRDDDAESLFLQTLKLLPEAAPGLPYFTA